ncbi:hypothetical protein RLEG12_13460 [Rhizobium leguminosarum bv. trifolii CB782]|nr:hypothetical protein RLEG12_13460 [Rhizobium leguminosarum bv. trifolii CB782]
MQRYLMAQNDAQMSELGKLLFVTYAFPPLHVAVAPCVTKVLAGLSRAGFSVDVICVSAPGSVALDESLSDFVKQHARSVVRVSPSMQPRGLAKFKYAFGHWLLPLIDRTMHKRFSRYPREWASSLYRRMRSAWAIDPMNSFQRQMFEAVCQQPLEEYSAIISWSPYHSINRVMAKVKSHHPRTPWIAQFSDPWAGNPLETEWQARLCAKRNELRTVSRSDYIIHNSERSLELMKRNGSIGRKASTRVIRHPFDETLYPKRPKARNNAITLRYVGTLFGRRSPEHFFRALKGIVEERPELRQRLCVELIGSIEDQLMTTEAAKSLVNTIIHVVPPTDYIGSLELMYDADINLLIEANTDSNLFMPSKLSDYIGASRPILGLVPKGPVRDAVRNVGGWVADAGDVREISSALLQVIDYVNGRQDTSSWICDRSREEFNSARVADEYRAVISELTSK